LKKWLEEHLAGILTIVLVVIMILCGYYITTTMCMDCPPTNITAVLNELGGRT